MTDMTIAALLDEAEKAQRKGHLVLARALRDASDRIGLVQHERDTLRTANSVMAGELAALRGQLDVSDAYAAEANPSQVPSVWQLQNALLRAAISAASPPAAPAGELGA
ncbi:hypothetical protein [Falsiroseomonas sp.]|uniref:hypothetical protein n=1 Tax=Falsiroseomonas sp. TaxID=2870721 RepID=UPI00273345E6|nr:hypothetical protein [Falsiroseomonas sp.]MDP3417900.1 hypothetical protein [Falsiroseomonas sp.]